MVLSYHLQTVGLREWATLALRRALGAWRSGRRESCLPRMYVGGSSSTPPCIGGLMDATPLVSAVAMWTGAISPYRSPWVKARLDDRRGLGKYHHILIRLGVLVLLLLPGQNLKSAGS